MAWVTICKDDNSFIRPNFRAKEFYSTSAAYGYTVPDCHPMDSKLFDAAQWLRDITGVPWSLTSTMRVLAHNRAIGSKDTSLHIPGRAVDMQPTNSAGRKALLKKVFADIAAKGPIYVGLRERGINGIGAYNSFIHLDTRETFAAWDFSGRSFNLPKITTAFLSCVPEPDWSEMEAPTCLPEDGAKKKSP